MRAGLHEKLFGMREQIHVLSDHGAASMHRRVEAVRSELSGQIKPMNLARSDKIAIAAVFAAALAAMFSGFQWYEAHEQRVLAFRPTVTFWPETVAVGQPKVGLAITNGGPGLAVIKSLSYYVDRVPVSDSLTVLEYGKLNKDLVYSVDLDDGDILAAGQTIWLFSHATNDKHELDRFIDFIDKHLAAQVTYCAVDGECQTRCSDKGRC
jgi:hypothetical protein